MSEDGTEQLARPVPPPAGLVPPTGDEVFVWWATTDVSPSVLESLRGDLDEDTLARTNALVREADRRRTIVAHGLLRRVVAACTGTEPAAIVIQRICASCGASDHGKPSLVTPAGAGRPPLQFNLAHSGHVVAVAVAGPDTDVGIDVEALQDGFDWLPARRHVFTDAEWGTTDAAGDPAAERFALWARKEAAAKTTGHGLAIDLVHVAIDAPTPADSGDGGLVRRGRLVAPERTYELTVADVALAHDTAAAVAVLDQRGAPQTPRITLARADLA
jgi:4'-phosphopantetheinyl transferase